MYGEMSNANGRESIQGNLQMDCDGVRRNREVYDTGNCRRTANRQQRPASEAKQTGWPGVRWWRIQGTGRRESSPEMGSSFGISQGSVFQRTHLQQSR